jgi:hypothetical protein
MYQLPTSSVGLGERDREIDIERKTGEEREKNIRRSR